MSASGGVGLNTRWQPIAVEAVRVGKRLRPLSPEHVSRLRDSFALLGSQLQLQPIVVDAQLRLIDGAHRLEAARQAGWSSISALIVEGADPERLDLIGFEANLVRRNLGPAELESVWRTHYEPLLRERARERRSAAPRGGRNRAVIGNSDNDVPRNPALSISASARAVTGLSLDTLHKVSEIREIAECEDLPEVIRVAARRAMARLSSPRAGVDPLHRRIVELRRSYLQPQGGDGRATRSESEARFMRVAEEVMRLDERFETGYVFELEQLVRASESNRELLRTMRASLARSLAAVVSVECRLEPQPVSALRVVGAEVSRLLSRSSLAHLTSRAPEQPGGS